MDLVQTAINAGVIAVVSTLVALFMRSQTRDLKEDLRRVEGNLRQEIKDLRTEMNERFRDQGQEITSLRSDLTQLALALGTRPQPQTG